MKRLVITTLILIVSFSVKAGEVIPDEICGQWQTVDKQILRGDDDYDSAGIVIRSDGLCPFWISPPQYPARIVLKKAEEPDEFFYQIEDQGKVVEAGILHYVRTADVLSFKVFGKETRFVRIEQLLDQGRESEGRDQVIVVNQDRR